MESRSTVREESIPFLPYPVKVEQPMLHDPSCTFTEASVVEISSSSSGGVGGYGDLQNFDAEVSSPRVSKRPNSSNKPITNGSVPAAKRPRFDANGHPGDVPVQRKLDAGLPDDFLKPLEEIHPSALAPQTAIVSSRPASRPSIPNPTSKVFRQFWKAGDYESDKTGHEAKSSGMDHVRVHPKFLHSNATSHKWALGAVAELLDNALDEVVHGATFVKVDMIKNPKNGEPMLLVEDDGGGMNPENMRQCMSLGYSAKSKIAHTIGQYGNGFKTSTMRLGADVIVFSRCRDSKGLGPTESVGMLSYTFLRETGQADIIVPMIDYEIKPFGLRKLIRSNVEDWNRNMESLKRWSPFATEAEIMDHFRGMKEQGTKIIVYNLWEDDQGELELDFVTNQHDIQLRGANRDERQISMAERFPNSQHYLTYQHSLRSYASILYRRLPPGFRMFLRGKEIKHHNLINDLMFTEVWTYKPVGSDVQTDTGQMKAVVTVGFVKDAKDHIDVQGFNVYHKNRLIKPFWRLWNSAASRGRGIIGVLEANFVEPAHDKQGFERTIVLARLEARLLEMQKTYWSKHCHKVGYVNNTLKGKDRKAVGQKEVQSSGDTVHPTTVVSRSVPQPMILEPPCFPVQAGHLSDVHASSILERPMQLQTQTQVDRHVHHVHTVHPQVLRQRGSQALPTSGGFPSQRSTAPMVESARRVTPSLGSSFVSPLHPQVSQVFPTISQVLATNQPSPAARNETSNSQAHLTNHVSPAVRSMTTNSQVLLTNHVSSAVRTMASNSQVLTDHVLPAVRNMANNSTSPVALQNVLQYPLIHSSTVSGDVRSQPPFGSMSEVKTAAACVQSVDQSSCRLEGFTSGNSHEIQSITLSPAADLLGSNVSNRYGRDNGQTCEEDSPSAVLDTSMIILQADEKTGGPTGVCIEQGQAQVDGGSGGCSEQNGQGLPNAGTLSASRLTGVESIVAEVLQRQSVQKILESSDNSKHRLAKDAADNCRVESTCVPMLTPSCNLPGAVARVTPSPNLPTTVPMVSTSSNLPSTAPMAAPSFNAAPNLNLNISGAARIQPEQSLLRAPKLSNKDLVLGRKSLVDLGRMFARKAASITMNQGDQTNKVKDFNAKAIEPVVTDLCPSTHTDLEAHLMELELEVRNLQQRLEALKVERDELKDLLHIERKHGQLKKQELQKKVEQTWAKVRELEAQNEQLQLVQQ